MKIKVYDKKGDLILEETICGMFHQSNGDLDIVINAKRIIYLRSADYSSYCIL